MTILNKIKNHYQTADTINQNRIDPKTKKKHNRVTKPPRLCKHKLHNAHYPLMQNEANCTRSRKWSAAIRYQETIAKF